MRTNFSAKLDALLRLSQPRAYAGLALVLLVGLIWLVRAALSAAPEPTYAGKTAGQWLNAGYEDASQALQQIGPPAVPFILAKLAREDPQYGALRTRRDLWNKIPAAVRNFFPTPAAGAFDELHACSILVEMGPAVMPLLSSALRDRNPAVREVSADALGRFRQQGKDLSKAKPFLVDALHDPVAGVRRRAAEALDRPLSARQSEQ